MAIVFDVFIPMYDKDGCVTVEESIDKLDLMLTTYGIEHAFTLPHDATLERHPDTVVELHYDSELDLTVGMIYALHAKLYRGAKDENIAAALSKITAKLLQGEGDL